MTRSAPQVLHPTIGLFAAALLVTACAGDDWESPHRQRTNRQFSDSAIFINEIHYDNVGTDSGEAVEIAAPAGTDLSGFSLVFYNGANGAVYRTTSLSGVVPDQQNGLGTLTFALPTDGIQNGSPDGVALVTPTGEVLLFLSYEGIFVAVGGPASGLTSTDIGVVEGADTPLGSSLALSGNGDSYADFTWSTATTATFGTPNGAQTFTTGSDGSGGQTGAGGEPGGGGSGGTLGTPVFINELHYDNVGADAGEAVELAGPAGTDLAEFSLVFYNGANGAAYRTTALTGILPNQQSGFGVLAFTLPTDGIQNGSPDGIALVNGLGEVLSFLSYEGSFTAVGGPADGLTSTDIDVAEGADTPVGFSLGLAGNGAAYADFVWSGATASTFGLPNAGQTFGMGGGSGGADGSGGAPGSGGSAGSGGAAAEVCGAVTTAISAVQGSGTESPLSGQIVSVEGVVVGDFQGAGSELGGFFVQSETPDGDPLTSEGVFVFDQNLSPAVPVNVGDRVRVRGAVSEYFGLTEVTAGSIVSCGTTPLPEPSSLPLPFADALELEAHESMLVRASNLTVTETYNLGRFGEVVLSADGRLFHPNSELVTPIPNARRRILLDDGRDGQNLEPVPYLGDEGTLRLGDTLPELTAVLHYAFDLYRLQPVDRSAVSFAPSNPRTSAPESVGGDLKVASLNVLNYFTTLNDRGANTTVELERQRAKLVSAVVGLNADVLGLMEIENSEAALDDFVASVNAALGSPVYARAPSPSLTGTDAIRTAIIYKPARVTPTSLTRSDEADVHNRPPIAQGFSYLGNDFTVIVNHFKSKGSCPASASDPNAEFGQGCWNPLRVEQAEALLSFIEELTFESSDDDVVVLGDLNSYLGEDPIEVLEEGGLLNQVRTIPEAARYSYVFEGESGTLDYILTSASLAVTGATIWHINSDEPRILDYNTEFNPASAYQAHAYRSSDHDPVVIGLSLPALPGYLVLDLIAAVDGSGLPAGAKKDLLKSLLAASDALTKDGVPTPLPELTAKQRKAAKKNLGQFLEAIDCLARRGKITPALSGDLVARATAILQLVGG